MSMAAIDISKLFLLFIVCTVSSAIIIHFAANLVKFFRLVDRAGEGHKLHDINTPFVGGVGLLTTLAIAFIAMDFLNFQIPDNWYILGICSVILFVTGFIDDTIRLSYKLRLLIQSAVAFIMIFNGDMIVNSLGNLLWFEPLELHWIIAVIFTTFAVIGSINAVNMIDGMDGLSGSVSLASLSLMFVVVLIASDSNNLILITALSGGLVGFLYYNLRYSSKRSARVFLGDNGSMLIGFIFAWLFIDISQGTNPAVTPVTVVWFFAIPLLDTLSVILRRLSLGQSPFHPDHLHLHHLFLRSGFFVTEITSIIAFLHIFIGLIGLAGLYLKVNENLMLLSFILVFIIYLYLTLHPFRFISKLRCFRIALKARLGLAPAASYGTFCGYFNTNETESLTKIVNEELGPNTNFSIRIFEQTIARSNSEKYFAITLNIWLTKNDCISEEQFKQQILLLQNRFEKKQGSDRIDTGWGGAFGRIGRTSDYVKAFLNKVSIRSRINHTAAASSHNDLI